MQGKARQFWKRQFQAKIGKAIPGKARHVRQGSAIPGREISDKVMQGRSVLGKTRQSNYRKRNSMKGKERQFQGKAIPDIAIAHNTSQGNFRIFQARQFQAIPGKEI